jgi:hypothetical protein
MSPPSPLPPEALPPFSELKERGREFSAMEMDAVHTRMFHGELCRHQGQRARCQLLGFLG